jgi:hypothetical protein
MKNKHSDLFLCSHRGMESLHVYTAVLIFDFLHKILGLFFGQNNLAHNLTKLRLHHLELHRNDNVISKQHRANCKNTIINAGAKLNTNV